MNSNIHTSPKDSPQSRVTPLHGFSGCEVILIETPEKSFVRKIAADVAYNERLQKQMTKQVQFQAGKDFLTAAVIASGTQDSGLFYFDMDYISGASAAELIAAMPLSEIQHWSQLLLNLARGDMREILSPALFQDKLSDLQKQLAQRQLTRDVQTVLQLLTQRAWDNIPSTPCHGDATLENMILHDRQIVMIDFLDSFAESWFIDIAKLMQDLRGRWSFRYDRPSHNLFLRLSALRLNFEQLLNEQHPRCMTAILDLYALNLLRIIPYCVSAKELSFVERLLSELLPDL
jgi:hypothetical protein